MKFIHIADIHLGAKPDKEQSWGEEWKYHNWKAFTKVISKAKEEQVQILLIAGDLFHRQPLPRELKEVNQQFSNSADACGVDCRKSRLPSAKFLLPELSMGEECALSCARADRLHRIRRA